MEGRRGRSRGKGGVGKSTSEGADDSEEEGRRSSPALPSFLCRFGDTPHRTSDPTSSTQSSRPGVVPRGGAPAPTPGVRPTPTQDPATIGVRPEMRVCSGPSPTSAPHPGAHLKNGGSHPFPGETRRESARG